MRVSWTATLLLAWTLVGCDETHGILSDGGFVDGSADGMADGMSGAEMGEADAEPDAEADAWVEPLRINHIQVRGTDNSYHDYPDRWENPEETYRHLPFPEQLAVQGIRQFDFDVWGNGQDVWVNDRPAPPMTFAFCDYLVECMGEIAAGIANDPDHLPIMILVGETRLWDWMDDPTPFFWHVDEIEKAFVRAFGRDRMLSPADVRGHHPDLETAIAIDGWPTLAEARGKIIAVLNEHGAGRAEYLEFGGIDPADRFLFHIADRDALAPDEMIVSFPQASEGDLAEIERLSSGGRLVHATTEDPAMVPRLRAAGAHMVASRRPDEVLGVMVGDPSLCNPLTAPADCSPARIEPPAVAAPRPAESE